jgi:hypothetical protein
MIINEKIYSIFSNKIKNILELNNKYQFSTFFGFIVNGFLFSSYFYISLLLNLSIYLI